MCLPNEETNLMGAGGLPVLFPLVTPESGACCGREKVGDEYGGVGATSSCPPDTQVQKPTLTTEFWLDMGQDFPPRPTLRVTSGFPGGGVVGSPPADAGDTGSSPGLGGSHMLRSNWAHKPQLLSLRVWSLCSTTRGRDSERPAHRDEEWPPLAAARESPRTETKTQHNHKLIN